MGPLISLIIPVYNVEKYIDRCMESILNQTYENFEVILVDDGSTDNSGKMCDEYAGKYDGVRVLHQKNLGVCKARNVGIDNAQGDFLSFIDADDWVDKEYLEILLKAQQEQDFDLTMCEFTNIDDLGMKDRRISFNATCKFFGDEIKNIVTPKTLLNDNKQMIGNPYCKLFRKKILLDSGIRYCEAIRLHEDRLFNYEYCQHIISFSYLSIPLYTRYMRPDSAMHIYREDFLQEYGNICNELCRIIHKYGSINKTVEQYCAVITIGNVISSGVCNPLNTSEYKKRWKAYYKFLSLPKVKEIYCHAKLAKNLPLKYKAAIILIRMHLTIVIDLAYKAYRKLEKIYMGCHNEKILNIRQIDGGG